MKKIAVYIEDVFFGKCPVYEYNPITGYFEMLGDRTFKFAEEEVMTDDGWLVFELK